MALGSEGGDLIGGADLHAVAGGFPVESALQAAGEGNGIAGGALRYGLGGPPPENAGQVVGAPVGPGHRQHHIANFPQLSVKNFLLLVKLFIPRIFMRFHLEEKVEIKQLLLLVWAEMLGY